MYMLERSAINSSKACKDVFKIVKNVFDRGWFGPGQRQALECERKKWAFATTGWQLVPTWSPPPTASTLTCPHLTLLT